jgi:hypothetical protein
MRQAERGKLSATMVQVLTLELRLEGNHDPFAAQSLFQDFRASLERYPGVKQVKPLKLPSSLSPEQPIDSAMFTQSSGKDNVFSLQIEIGPPDAPPTP